ncbi:hypothetical protein [uncultured Nostoc sp.]|uniref:hypothetical protein n=1 Tax=uncultured Nostoc sp. TaxID=340711 RepID=UPI0035CB97E4
MGKNNTLLEKALRSYFTTLFPFQLGVAEMRQYRSVKELSWLRQAGEAEGEKNY